MPKKSSRTYRRIGELTGPDPASEFTALGPPPDDPLAATQYVHRSLALTYWHAQSDPQLTERERRRELREIARTMRDLVPQSRLFDAEAIVRGDMAKGLGDDGGAELSAAAPVKRRRAKRGRPSKRPVN